MRKILLYIFLIVVAATACGKRELLRYNADNDIYFNYLRNNQAYDTIQKNFSLKLGATEDSAVFFVNLLGKVSSINRPFRIEVDSRTTAESGRHYTLPSTESFVIPADTNNQRIAVMIHRTPDLYEKSVSLFLKLQPNEYFNTGMLVHNYSAAQVSSSVLLHVIISDILNKPGLWDANVSSLGEYSRKKLETFVANQQLTLLKFYSGTLYSAAQLASAAKQFQIFLNLQKNGGTPILEENGSEMKMGPAAQ